MKKIKPQIKSEKKLKYLIVKCRILSDQFECEADKTPLFLTDDWKRDYPKKGYYEVYELTSTTILS
jgi:hypothetical protein